MSWSLFRLCRGRYPGRIPSWSCPVTVVSRSLSQSMFGSALNYTGGWPRSVSQWVVSGRRLVFGLVSQSPAGPVSVWVGLAVGVVVVVFC